MALMKKMDGKIEKVLLSTILVLAVLFTISSIVYVIKAPERVEAFTEFYILGTGGKAEDYPAGLRVGEQGQVIVGVVNHEHAPVAYTMDVKMGDYVTSNIGPFTLNYGQKWENPVPFSANSPHDSLKVEFLLYRAGDTEPYRSLHLFVKVNQAAGVPVPEVPPGYAVPQGSRSTPLFYQKPAPNKKTVQPVQGTKSISQP